MITTTQKAIGSAVVLVAVTAAPAAAQAVIGVLAAGPFSSIWSFILEGQRELTTAMTDAVSGLKSGNLFKASMTLGTVSFIYGVLHAIGPGHGKFVISAYALANEKTVRRGILLSFMAALIQALSAIAIVGTMAIIFKATSIKIKATEAWLETLSWAIIAGLGAWLLWGQLQPLLRRRAVGLSHAGHDHGNDDGHSHGHHDHKQGHDHGHVHTAACNHAHDNVHVHDEHCGHTHMATPEQLRGPWSWSHAWSMAFSIGIRPCTGAIGVLLFALAAGMFWAGVLATFAMAIGTALTVSALASIAVGSRELAKRVSGFDTPAAARVQLAAGVAGSALVMMMGLAFFFASLGNSGRL